MGFSVVMVAIFIAVIGILSVCAQLILGFLMRVLGSKKTIMVGLFLEMLQLLWYGLGSQTWSVLLLSFSGTNYAQMLSRRMMWGAGLLASISSITYPAISAFVSMHTDADKQGTQSYLSFILLSLTKYL